MTWDFWFNILAIRWTKQYTLMMNNTFDNTLCGSELYIHTSLSYTSNIWMRKAMITKYMSFIIDSFRKKRILLSIASDDKKSCWNLLFLEYIEDLWSRIWIWSVIKSKEYLLILYISITCNYVR